MRHIPSAIRLEESTVLRIKNEKYAAVMSFLIGIGLAAKRLYSWYWSSGFRAALTCIVCVMVCYKSYIYLAAFYINHATLAYIILVSSFVLAIISALKTSENIYNKLEPEAAGPRRR